MTNKEALITVSKSCKAFAMECGFSKMCDTDKKALNILKELVEKATPKKPTKYKTIHHSIEDIILYKCQCGCCLSYAYNFCPKCGQAIKWGDDS